MIPQPMPLIINFVPTGLIPTRDMTPHVPLSVADIVADVRRAVEIGITMVHLHARAPDGTATTGGDVYEKLIFGIREFAPALIVCVSLSGRAAAEFRHRMAPLELGGPLKPDMGSLTLSSVNFNRDASINAPDTIQRLARELQQRQIKPELEAFDAGMINYAKYLARKELLSPPYYFNLLLGNVACAQADLLHAGVMVRDLPPQSVWSLAGIGRAQLPMNGLAIAAGDGVRIGLEDNIWYDHARTRLATNAELLARVHRLATDHGRSIMSPAECRQLLNLAPGNGAYGTLT